MSRIRNRCGRGFTLLECSIALVVLAVGVLGATLALTTSLSVGGANAEDNLAINAARQKIAEIQSNSFPRAFSDFSDPKASTFEVPGLPKGSGKISFPGNGTTLLEQFVDAKWGMPRDLNGDGVLDSADHSTNYTLLPVKITIEWRS